MLAFAATTLGCTGKAQTNDPRVCPAGRPAEDAGCAVEGLRCTYGASCGESAQCTGGSWRAASDGCGDAAPGCPSSVPRSGVACSGGLRCPYPCGDGGTAIATCTANAWAVTASGCALPG